VKSVRQKVSFSFGGQRQTVAIARAVLKNARVVILDEPTAALGVAQTEQVLNLVKAARRTRCRGIIISHNLVDVFAVADYISVLYLGQMVATVDPQNRDQRRCRRLHHGKLRPTRERTHEPETADGRPETPECSQPPAT